MVNQIIISKNLETKFQNFEKPKIELILGLTSPNQIFILEKLPILNKNHEKLNLEIFSKKKINEYLEFIVDEIGCKISGGIKILGFIFFLETEKIENQKKDFFEMKIKSVLNFFKKSNEFLDDELLMVYKNKNDLQVNSISYINQISSNINNIKFKENSEYVSNCNLYIKKKFYLEKKNFENLEDLENTNYNFLDEFVNMIKFYINNSDYFFEKKIIDKKKNFICEKKSRLNLIQNNSDFEFEIENEKNYKVFFLNFDLCGFFIKNNNFKFVLNSLFEDFKRTLFCRIENGTDLFSKRIFLEKNDVFYSVYSNKINMEKENCKNIKLFFDDDENDLFLDNEDFSFFEKKIKNDIIINPVVIKKNNDVEKIIDENFEEQKEEDENKNKIEEEKKEFLKSKNNSKKKIEVPPFYFVVAILLIAFILKKFYFDK